jgi:peptidyl-Asp metalloendopeptidase
MRGLEKHGSGNRQWIAQGRSLSSLGLLVAGVVLLFPAIGARPAEGQEPELLRYLDRAWMTAPAAQPAAVAEYLVELDVAALAESDVRPGTLLMPDQRVYQALPERIELREGEDLAWRGRLIGPEGRQGRATLTVRGGHVAGRIELLPAIYELLPDPERRGWSRLVELDDAAFPECGGTHEPDAPLGPAWFPTPTHHDPEIDLMVVYTPASRVAAGGTSQIRAVIQAAVDVTNDSYENSGVHQRVALVHMEEVPYNESGTTMSQQLAWVRNDPGVAALRDAHYADLVAFITEGTGACGVAYVMRNVSVGFAPWAFSVTARSCAVGNLTFAHELGHNMGAEHNPEDSSVGPGGASYPYSFGHRVPGSFRTVMAYNCSPTCPRVPHFSNPMVLVNGLPSGIFDERENARTLNNTGPVVEQFRVAPEETVSPPLAISGPSTGEPGELLSFTGSGAVSDLGHTLEYRFQWGDGTTSPWASATQETSFESDGSYELRAQARCAAHTDRFSEWSEALMTVTISSADCELTVLTDLEVSASAIYEACTEVRAGPNVTVSGSGDLHLAAGLRVSLEHGFSVSGSLRVSSCGQPLCTASSEPMVIGCHSCATSICAVDPGCCSEGWSSACVEKVAAVCGLSCP